MRLQGWLSNFNEKDGLTPLELQDVDFHMTVAEMRALSKFLEQTALKIEVENIQNLTLGLDFSDDKPNPQTGIWFNLIYHRDENVCDDLRGHC